MHAAPWHTREVRVSDELVLHCEIAGNGDTAIVLVPGWTMSSEVYEHQLAHFAGSVTFRAVAFDPRSQGRSTQTPSGNTPGQHARDLRSLITELKLTSVILVGWSNGGFDVLEYVYQFGTEGLRGLVMLDACPSNVGADPTTNWVWFNNQVAGNEELKFFLHDLAEDRDAGNREFATWMFQDPTKGKVDFAIGLSNRTPTPVAVTLNASYLFSDHAETLANLSGRLPLLYYVRSEAVGAAARWAAAHTPDATVQGHGCHMMFWEDPAPFSAALESFAAHCVASATAP